MNRGGSAGLRFSGLAGPPSLRPPGVVMSALAAVPAQARLPAGDPLHPLAVSDDNRPIARAIAKYALATAVAMGTTNVGSGGRCDCLRRKVYEHTRRCVQKRQ